MDDKPSAEAALRRSHKAFHERPKPELPKSQYRCVNVKLHPSLFAEVQLRAARQHLSLTDWVTAAVEMRISVESE